MIYSNYALPILLETPHILPYTFYVFINILTLPYCRTIGLAMLWILRDILTSWLLNILLDPPPNIDYFSSKLLIHVPHPNQRTNKLPIHRILLCLMKGLFRKTWIINSSHVKTKKTKLINKIVSWKTHIIFNILIVSDSTFVYF